MTTIDLNAGALAPVADEIDAVDLRVSGAIPRELNGVLVRNGPNPLRGRFDGSDVLSWWPEDAMCCTRYRSTTAARHATATAGRARSAGRACTIRRGRRRSSTRIRTSPSDGIPTMRAHLGIIPDHRKPLNRLNRLCRINPFEATIAASSNLDALRERSPTVEPPCTFPPISKKTAPTSCTR